MERSFFVVGVGWEWQSVSSAIVEEACPSNWLSRGGRWGQCYTRTQCFKTMYFSKHWTAGGNATPGRNALHELCVFLFQNIGPVNLHNSRTPTPCEAVPICPTCCVVQKGVHRSHESQRGYACIAFVTERASWTNGCCQVHGHDPYRSCPRCE